VRARRRTLGALEQPGTGPSAKCVHRRFRHVADCTARGRIERMRIAAVHMLDRALLAVDVDGDRRRLDFEGDLLSLVRAGVDPHELAVGEAVAGELAPPLQPGKIVAIGLNYLDHIRESNLPRPAQPLVFAKFPSSVTGPADPIVVDAELTAQVDWEVELGVVVGRRMRDVSVDVALDYVFGYTVGNDVSARDVQFSESQWTRGKSFDTFCPLGPVVVTADEIPDPQALALRTRVNGEVMQDSSTAEMLFGVAELLAFCSRSFTLEPGDLLLTGTPWGCGYFMDPRRALEVGDLVECEVEGIGVLRNPVSAG
jgi:2-keto-4-pentenoate hydratase/2-oxohepta-3-ene-1,7-dioic acid hydratase in catechol pathway